jgi:hypothetical protein
LTIVLKDSRVENPETEETLEKGSIPDKAAANLLDIPLIPFLKQLTACVNEREIIHSNEVDESEFKFKADIGDVPDKLEEEERLSEQSDEETPIEALASD